MKRLLFSALLFSFTACGDNLAQPDAGVDIYAVRSCSAFFHDPTITPPADVQEVRVDAYPFFTYTGPSYVAADGASTWTQGPREWLGHLGAWGERTRLTGRCIWLDAIEARTVATGEP